MTVSSGPPAFLVDLLARRSAWRGRLDALRLFTCAGAKLGLDVAEEVVRVFPGRMSKAFGMTEVGHVCSTAAEALRAKLLGTEGEPHPEIEMRVVDADGSPVGRGEEGEIAFRGPFVMVGYHDDRFEGAIDQAGFFRTGDLGYADADGYLVVTGRVKNMIIRGGENIPAETVERSLLRHELIDDAVVVGVPDRRLGERPVACLQVVSGFIPRVADLAEHLEQSGISAIHWPESVLVVDTIPRGDTGKVSRLDLRRMAADRAVFEGARVDG